MQPLIMNKTGHGVAIFSLCCLLMKGAVAIYCVQCSSLEDPLCSIGLVRPTKCQDQTTACLTYIGKMPIPGADIIIRDCADKDHGNFCQEIPSGPNSFGHSFCVKTCYTSQCNDSPMKVPQMEPSFLNIIKPKSRSASVQKDNY